MRWFFDTEFIDTGCTINLISIGLVSDEGTAYSACLSDGWELAECDPWLTTHVLSRLPPHEARKCRKQVSEEIVSLAGPKPEFWGYYSAYDWVALCQLVAPSGRMLDLPEGWPRLCFDLKQFMILHGFEKTDLPSQDEATKHDVLSDAQWVKDSFQLVRQKLARRLARIGCLGGMPVLS